MKRLLSIALLLCVCITFSACGKNDTAKTLNENNELTLVLREGTYADVIKAELETFEKKHGVTCDVMEFSEDELRKKVVNPDEDDAIDLCMVDGSWIAESVEKKTLLPLSDYDYSLDKDIIPATTVVSYYDNELYVAPFYGNVTVLFYNKASLKEVDCVESDITSLMKLYQTCSDAQKQGRLGFLYRGDTNNNIVVDFLPILLSFGGWVVDEENYPTINSTEFKNAFNFYLNLVQTGKAMEKEELIEAIENGSATAAIGWPGWYMVGEDTPAGYSALYGRFSDTSPTYNANVYGIWTLGVSSRSKNPEMAVELLKYLMDQDVQLESMENGGVPCRYSCLENEGVLKKHPEYEEVRLALERGQYRPIIPNWNEFCEILGTQMKRGIDGKAGVEECAEEAQKQLEELLKKET